MASILDDIKFNKAPSEEEHKISSILDIVEELDDFEYGFIMDISERSWYTERQSELINEMHYKYIERWI